MRERIVRLLTGFRRSKQNVKAEGEWNHNYIATSIQRASSLHWVRRSSHLSIASDRNLHGKLLMERNRAAISPV